jgi:hypothetical protein
MLVSTDPVWRDFLDYVALRNEKHIYFRGHASSGFGLVPGIGRKDKQPPGGWSLPSETELFGSFRREARRYEVGHGFSDLAWLALAQHCGLPTRLLDWTTNPLVAAWFAVCDDEVHRDSAGNPLPAVVHVIHVKPGAIVDEDDPLADPFDPFAPDTEARLVRVPALAARITAQQGLFSLHAAPAVPWVPARSGHFHEVFAIPFTSKAYFKRALHQLGVDRHRLMVDLDGLCATLTWAYKNGR